MCKSLMPLNPKGMKNKWVSKIKWNGVYWVCLVACGYNQVPGVDVSKNYLHLFSDITFHILLQMVIYFQFSAKLVNIKTAFLHRKLEEESIWHVPKVCWA